MINHDNFIIYYCFIIDHTGGVQATETGSKAYKGKQLSSEIYGDKQLRS